MQFYILEGKTPVRAINALVWGQWFERANRTVARSVIGETIVSTVFLGIDHQWGSGPPLLFETMIFGAEEDEYQDRCSTWTQAEAMHKKALRTLRKSA